MDPAILSHVQNNEHYFAENANVNGQPYFGYYIPIMENGKYTGAAFTGIPQADTNAVIVATVAKTLGGIVIIGVFSLVAALFLISNIVKGIAYLSVYLKALLKNDLTAKAHKYVKVNDEMKELCNLSAEFGDNLCKAINGIRHLAGDVNTIAEEFRSTSEFTARSADHISRAGQEIAEGSQAQAQEIMNATEKMKDMADGIGIIHDNVDELHVVTESMNNAKDVVQNALTTLQDTTDTIADDVKTMNEQAKITYVSVQTAQKALEVINSIASQTNLLSLNASIESARAGEAGKGFAVVATEIRQLSEMSSAAADEIKKILSELGINYDTILQIMDMTNKNVEIQNEKINETQNAFRQLENDINTTVKDVENITGRVGALDEDNRSMLDIISNVSAVSQENSAATQETSANILVLTDKIEEIHEKTQVLHEHAEGLMREINAFKTEG